MKKKKNIMIVNLLQKPVLFLANWRPLPIYELLSYVLMYASVPMIAYGIQPLNGELIQIIFLTILTLYSGFFAALIWNDITDVEIDRIAHPGRPVPSGLISKTKFFIVALLFSGMTFFFASLVSIWCLALVGGTALFVAIHNKYLKKMIKFPAYSEIFTPIQWLTVALFGYLALWTAIPSVGDISYTFPIVGYISFTMEDFGNMILLLFFTYFADNAHDLPEGIHDVDGDRRIGVKTYATTFGERTAAKISLSMFFISGIFGFLLVYRGVLTYLFLIPFLFIWINIIYFGYKLVKSKDNDLKKMGKIVGRKGFNYLLFSYDLIFLDIFIRQLLFYYGM